jgi:hypothetical protein
MKYLVLASTIWTTLVCAEVGPQPLSISRISILPEDGCNTGEVTIELTAAGGQPAQGGLYSYFKDGFNEIPQVTQKAIFKNVIIDEGKNFLVSDAAKNIIAVEVTAGLSQSEEISVELGSLPLGNGAGCMTARVVRPGGLNEGSVSFTFRDITTGEILSQKTVTATPFELTSPVFASEEINVSIGIDNDCEEGVITAINFFLNFPKGIANSLKAYLFNKYCSC